MAFNQLKKWVGTQLWSTFMTEYNENVDELNRVIDGVNTHMAEMAWGEYKDLTLLNGWTGTLRYRKNGMNLVWIYGEITPGVTDRSTTIAILPSGYRPPQVMALPAQSHSVNTGGLTGIALTAAGNLNIYGDAADKISTHNVRINYVYKAI